jgi:hypothetical protein
MFEMFETTNQIPSTAVELNRIEIGMGSDLLGGWSLKKHLPSGSGHTSHHLPLQKSSKHEQLLLDEGL